MRRQVKARSGIKSAIQTVVSLGLIAAILFTGIVPVTAQTPSPSPDPQGGVANTQTATGTSTDQSQDKDKPDDPAANKNPARGSWIIAPIPINSPAFEGGIILGVGYVFKLKMEDKVSPPSTIGAA